MSKSNEIKTILNGLPSVQPFDKQFKFYTPAFRKRTYIVIGTPFVLEVCPRYTYIGSLYYWNSNDDTPCVNWGAKIHNDSLSIVKETPLILSGSSASFYNRTTTIFPHYYFPPGDILVLPQLLI